MKELTQIEILAVEGAASNGQIATAIGTGLGGMGAGLGTIGSASAAVAFGGALAFTGGVFLIAAAAIYIMVE